MKPFYTYLLKAILYFILSLFATVMQAQDKAFATLSPEQQKEDLNAWRVGFTKDHPGMFRWASKMDLGNAFAQAWRATDQENDLLGFWHIVSRLNATVRCGHAPLGLPAPVARTLMNPNAKVVPLTVFLVKGDLYVKSVIGKQPLMKPGDKIESINGISTQEILEKVYGLTHADGFNKSVKRFDLEQKFAPLFKLYLEPDADTFEVSFSDHSGKKKNAQLAGATFQQWRGAVRSGAPPRPFEFSWVKPEQTGMIRLRTLSDGALERMGQDFGLLLDSIFVQLNKAGAEALILDIRGLSGGSDIYTIDLLSYLMEKPFRMFDRIEVTEQYEAAAEGSERAKWMRDKEGRKVIANHPGLQFTPPKANAFKGAVHLITDGGTFSAGADLAAALHKSDRATVYGEETGGGYAGNTSGPGEVLKLPNSGIQVPVRQWGYITAGVDPQKYKGGVPPHVPIVPDIKEFLASEDAVLDAVLDRINRK